MKQEKYRMLIFLMLFDSSKALKTRYAVIVLLITLLFTGCSIDTNNPAINNTAAIAVKKATCLPCKTVSRTTVFQVAFQKPVTNNTSAKDEIVFIKGGSFTMGSNEFPDAKPLHKVTVNSFWMDVHEVTNAQFAAFVKATGYITVAERALNPADYPDVPLEQLVPGSAVFTPPAHAVSLNDPMQWWKYEPGADWKHPLGPNSNIIGKENEPVVQVCYTDAAAYAKWAGKRLPREAEWEYAARAGKENENFYWGKELKPAGKWMANIFQGKFPYKNLKEDGYSGIAPVKSFARNAFGLYDMEGNVWEWCNDFYRPDYYRNSQIVNPRGPKDSYDPDEPGVEKHVQRGGSFLCSDEYCIRYKRGSRGKGETNSASNNLGFRCVKN